MDLYAILMFFYLYVNCIQVLTSVRNNLDLYASAVPDFHSYFFKAKQYLYTREDEPDANKTRSLTVSEVEQEKAVARPRSASGSSKSRECWVFWGRGGSFRCVVISEFQDEIEERREIGRACMIKIQDGIHGCAIDIADHGSDGGREWVGRGSGWLKGKLLLFIRVVYCCVGTLKKL